MGGELGVSRFDMLDLGVGNPNLSFCYFVL